MIVDVKKIPPIEDLFFYLDMVGDRKSPNVVVPQPGVEPGTY
jgi:hypothetical protein